LKKKKRDKPSKKEATPRIDLGVVPTHLHHRRIAPPSLPMRHDHPHVPSKDISHQEVRFVVQKHYMEQKPHVLLIESGLLSGMIVLFFALLLYLLRISIATYVPVLVAIWLLLVVLLYKFFEE
jgi:hypothetical protein